MLKLERIIISIVAVALLMGFAGVVCAADDSKDFSTFTCKELMRTSGEARDISVAFAHGYWLGKKGTTVYIPSKLGEATDKLFDTCLDNPNANALKTLGDILNK